MPDQKSSRRSFLSRLGFGTAAVAATAVVPNVGAPAKEVQPSLRPKCPSCGTLMLVREDAKCPNTECSYYWKSVGITFSGPQAERELALAGKRIEELRSKYLTDLEANIQQLGLPSAAEIADNLESELKKVDIEKENKRGR